MMMTGRVEELEKENGHLRRELQALRAERDVARGAVQSALAERVAAQELTGRLAAEERVTQQVLAEQSSNLSFVNVMLLLTFGTSLLMLLGLFLWLPARVAGEVQARRTTVVAAPAATAPAPPVVPVR